MDDRFRLFMRLWGVVALAHVVGNWQQPNVPSLAGLALFAVGLLGVGLAVAPGRRAFVALCAAILLCAVCETPRLYNHWLVAAIVSAAALLAGGRPDRFVPAARLVFLIFYVWAAFNKLNTGFFTPETSCGLFYANHSLEAAGLPTVFPHSPWAWVPIVGSALVELAIPPLLLVRRTRTIGVVLASTFHFLISLDLAQHFYDFTSVLIALLALFLPSATAVRFEKGMSRVPARARKLLSLGFTVLGGVMVGAAVVPVQAQTVFFVRGLPFVLWIPFGLAFLVAVVVFRERPEPLDFRAGRSGFALALLTLINGATPYLELKTAGGFNMYANLVTAQGRSNHWLIRGTLPLRDGYSGPVEILASSDAGLLRYRDRGYRIAFPEFRRYLATRPETSLTYRRAGAVFAVARAGDDPALSDAGPWWWRLFPLRSLDTADPPRCQDEWLPAL